MGERRQSEWYTDLVKIIEMKPSWLKRTNSERLKSGDEDGEKHG